MSIQTMSNQKPSNQTDSVFSQPDVLGEVSDFIARYLHCSEHQRTVLALWVLHTWCFRSATVTPYLSIQSAHQQSGKTLCLRLLSLLTEAPALTSKITASELISRMRIKPVSALLLDQSHASLGSRTRARGPALRALLESSFQWDVGYTNGLEERRAFCPKAFAGQGQLPEEIAAYCLPIILEPLPPRNQNGSQISAAALLALERFNPSRAELQAVPIRERLSSWAEEHMPLLEELPSYTHDAFPPSLSPRQQDMCEPLLQLAHAVGGSWPARLGEAFLGLFAEEAAFQLRPSLQLLAAVRDCFAHYGYPGRLPTAVIMEWVQALPSRPWEVDGRFSAQHLARMLGVFGIRPRAQRIGDADPARGYRLEAFREPWQQHLDFTAPLATVAPQDSEMVNKACPQSEPASRRACPRGELASRRDAGCNGVAPVATVSHDSDASDTSDTPTSYPEASYREELLREYVTLEAELERRRNLDPEKAEKS